MLSLLLLLHARVQAGDVASPVVVFRHASATVNPKAPQPTGAAPTCIRSPTVSRLGGQTLLAVAECRYWAGDGCQPDHLPRRLRGPWPEPTRACSRLSPDGGRTWGPLVHNVSGMGCGSLQSVWIPAQRKVLLAFNRHELRHLDVAHVLWYRLGSLLVSGNMTWEAPINVDERLVKPNVSAWWAACPGPGRALVLTKGTRAGRIILAVYSEGIAGSTDSDPGGCRNPGATPAEGDWAAAYFSDTGGTTWHVSKTSDSLGPWGRNVFPAMSEPSVSQLSNGSVRMDFRHGLRRKECKCSMFAISTDGGDSFGPMQFDRALISPECQGSMLSHGGSLYFSNPHNEATRSNLTVQRSSDRGVSWSAIALLSSTPQALASYSCLVDLDDEGSAVGVMWERGAAGCTGSSCEIVFERDLNFTTESSIIKTGDSSGDLVTLRHQMPKKKRVMLWTTNTLAFTNATERLAWLHRLSSVKDVVDVISPGSYYASVTWPHSLVRFPGATEVHTALIEAGFKVQPLVGGIGGAWQNAVFTSAKFIADAAAEIKDGGLEGLNFDWEPSQCAAESDSDSYANFIEQVTRQSAGGFVTVTFPCLHDSCDPAVLAKSAARVIDMQTYGGGGVNGTWNPQAWQRIFHSHVAAVGSARYGLGVCPQCCENPPACNRPLSAEDIATRLQMADEAGVREVDVFSDVEPPHDPYNASRWPVRSSMQWWTALRKWKNLPLLDVRNDDFIAGSHQRTTTESKAQWATASSPPLPSGFRFIAAANDSHCIPRETGAIWFEHIANRTRKHVSSCGTCGMADASGPCCNITRLPCAYIAALTFGGAFTCSDIPPRHLVVSAAGPKTDDSTSAADFSIMVDWSGPPVAVSPAISSWHDTALGASGNPNHDDVYPPSTFDIVEPINSARRQLRAPNVRLWSGTSYFYRWPNSTRVTPVGPAISPPNTTETCRFNFPNCSCCREYCAVGCPCCQVPLTTSWDFRALDINVANLQSSTAFPETNILQVVGVGGNWFFTPKGYMSEFADPTGAREGRWFANILDWYCLGGFTDERGEYHHSGHNYTFGYLELLNEMDVLAGKGYIKWYDGVVAVVRARHPTIKFIGNCHALQVRYLDAVYFLAVVYSFEPRSM